LIVDQNIIKMKFASILIVLIVLLSCKEPSYPAPESGEDQTILYSGQSLPLDKTLTTIVLGSCNKQNNDQEIWAQVLKHQPQLWVWLGDNVYSDTEDMVKMKSAYLTQKHNKHYKAFRKATPVIGIWDDHDYGVNDGDKNYPQKEAAQSLMMDFLDVHPESEFRTQKGAYQSYVFGEPGKKIKFILLDGRYFRDELQKNTGGKTRYLPNEDGDILGEAQWQWLRAELEKNEAQIHIIACGIQFIPEEQIFEKWANFPSARQRFFELIGQTNPNNILLLSGDRHITEYSAKVIEGLSYPLPELTCSALNNAYTGFTGEANAYRIGNVVSERNFGLLRINWTNARPSMNIEIRNLSNELVFDELINWQ
jgi:alkaline phosphatase D